jgi:hypothetical protein
MKNNKDMRYNFLFIVFIILIFGCIDRKNKRDENVKNQFSYKLTGNILVHEKFVFDDKNYQIKNGFTKMVGQLISFVDTNKIPVDEVDSSSLPNKLYGEYSFIEIKFINDSIVHLIRNSYSSIINPRNEYNFEEKWITSCKVVAGSKSVFNNGGVIKLISLNIKESDSSYSALMKGTMLKTLKIDPDKLNVDIKTSEVDILCSKKEILFSKKIKLNILFNDKKFRDKFYELLKRKQS